MDIHLLAADEGLRLRSIRRRALDYPPDAFGSTYEEAAARPLELWLKQLQEIATFIAVKNGEDIGVVRSANDEQDPEIAWLISMWVAPEARGQGVSDALIDTAIEHVRLSGASRLLLEVGNHNHPAIALYTRKGFRPNGKTSSLPAPRHHIHEHQRELRLS